MLLNLWNDERGYLLSAESVFLATILVIGLVAGWKSVNQAVNNELEDVGKAISSLDQTYSFCGTTGCCAHTNGSAFADIPRHYGVDTCFGTPQDAESCDDTNVPSGNDCGGATDL